ncbi:inositol monophosphatase family protein [Lentzea sp. HUAS12]|uniref:inositol monophosphatase family protein n=1 Tax=Lentzea sp. HUAS12 TaxID=2951806 RepID=UPI00209FEF58|nr:inositol monophosphatase family protein [Lentzea sp. HUAS12]USX52723.1 3'(2'),5'-bisphosphate nucleotidase CysQ [Lentzea sp. HUAS12]
MTTVDDHILASTVASSARDLLSQLRSEYSGSDLGDVGDRRAHELLVRELALHRPDDAVLSEEGAPVPAEARSGRLWIIDPLDGTREYTDRADDWAVHVALVEGGDLTAGAVALASGDTHGTATPTPLPASGAERLRVAVSRSHRPPLVDELAGVLDVELVPMGSAGVKTVAVCTGRVDAYVHDGGQYQWDSAAPVAVARAAGAHTSHLDGSAVEYRSADPRSEDLLVCRPEVAPVLLDALAGLLAR